jgi:hypothetical protein
MRARRAAPGGVLSFVNSRKSHACWLEFRPLNNQLGSTRQTLSTMSSITPDDLLRFASNLRGERLTTAARRAEFSVHVVPGGLEITPESSRKRRFVSREMLQMVLDEYDRTRSVRPGKYHHITFDSSYLLALVDRYVRERMRA